MCPFSTSAPHSPCFVRVTFANKQNNTAKARDRHSREKCMYSFVKRLSATRLSSLLPQIRPGLHPDIFLKFS
jgi:hypothetical protein